MVVPSPCLVLFLILMIPKKDDDDIKQKCSIEDFAIFFLNLTRSQTEDFQRGTTTSQTNTPHKTKSLVANDLATINTVIPIDIDEAEQQTGYASVVAKHQHQHQKIDESLPLLSNAIPLSLTQQQQTAITAITTNVLTATTNTVNGTDTPTTNKQQLESSSTSKIKSTELSKTSSKKKITLLTRSSLMNANNISATTTITALPTTNTPQQNISSINNSNSSFWQTNNSSKNLSLLDDSLKFTSSPINPKRKNLGTKNDNGSRKYCNLFGADCDDFKILTPNKSLENRFKSNTSTPIRKINNRSTTCDNSRTSNSINLSIDGIDRSSNANNNKNYSNTAGKNRNNTFCLGDYIVNASSSSSSSSGQSKQKNRNNKQITKDIQGTTSLNKIDNDIKQNLSSTAATATTSTAITATGSLTNTKPKRRVQPTQVLPTSDTTSTTISTFSCPAFRTENNILGISKEEIVDRENCQIRQERANLKIDKDAIAKEFEFDTKQKQMHLKNIRNSDKNDSSVGINENFPNKKSFSDKILKIDCNQIHNEAVLKRFVEIHSALIDLNLTTNDLNEMSYLLNFLNYSEFDDSVISSKKGNSSEEKTESTSSAKMNELPEKLINQINAAAEHDDDDNNKRNDSGVIGTSIDNDKLYIILKNFNNCLYYARGLLAKQRNLLALLDVTTLRVILDNENLEIFDKNLKEFLSSIYTRKLQLDSLKSNHEKSFKIGRSFQTVFYQQENDTKDNFLSENEFRAFKKQRDSFYEILKIWETKHLNHLWSFENDLRPKIHILLNHMDSPINMAHLAKLFTSQLIISSNFSESPLDLEINLPNIDLSKLTKLRQRLVAPSDFSIDYQFPGVQAFFRDFLLTSNSIVFNEQLKCVIISELIEMNNSSYEIINLSTSSDNNKIVDDDDDESANNSNDENSNDDNFIISQIQMYNDYVVRPEIISTMRVLGKFLGLLIAKPFSYDGNQNSLVDNRQIELRNVLRAEFDIMRILKTSIIERKLIITIPWLVQYLSMLDYVTLRLSYYRAVMEHLFELYENLKYTIAISSSSSSSSSLSFLIQNSCAQMRPTSKFILRLCLGWLFDNLNMTEGYYQYRQQIRSNVDDDNVIAQSKYIENEIGISTSLQCQQQHDNKMHKIIIQVPENVMENFNKNNEIITLMKINKIFDNNKIDCTLSIQKILENSHHISSDNLQKIMDKNDNALRSITIAGSDNNNTIKLNKSRLRSLRNSFDPLLENILNVSCPFLADFRVSIMPMKSFKCVSRTGRYRHITTKISSDIPTSITTTTTTPAAAPISLSLSTSNNNNSVKDDNKRNQNSDTQTKLIEAFLHSQSLSVRRIVEFVIERTTSAVIKDFQMEILLPSKTKALERINEIQSNVLETVINEMYKILTEIYNATMLKWDNEIRKMIDVRAKKALDALLPNETLEAVKTTCLSLIIKKCEYKTNDWRLTNLNGFDFYCKDIQADAEKLLKNNSVHLSTCVTAITPSAAEHTISTVLEININEPPIWKVFSKLKFSMHFSNLQPHLLNANELNCLLDEVLHTLKGDHKLPTSFFRVAGMMTVCLVQNLILKDFNIFAMNLFEKFIKIWQIDELKQFLEFTINENDPDLQCDNIFNSFLSEPYLRLLLHNAESYLMFSEILIILLNRNLITLNYLNYYFTKLFRLEWNQNENKKLSHIFENVSRNFKQQQHRTEESDAHSILYTEMLSDLMKDIDEY